MAISSTILTSTSYICGIGGLTIPMTVTLKSSDTTRKIELSTDGGTEYFAASLDIATPTMLVTTLTCPITNIKVTGVANDKLILVD